MMPLLPQASEEEESDAVTDDDIFFSNIKSLLSFIDLKSKLHVKKEVYTTTAKLAKGEENIVAIKALDLGSENDIIKAVSEISKSLKLQHPNIIRYHDVLVAKENVNECLKAWLIMGILPEKLGSRKLSSGAALNLLFQACHLILYLTKRNIIHCDIAKRNLRVTSCRHDENNVCTKAHLILFDFEFACSSYFDSKPKPSTVNTLYPQDEKTFTHESDLYMLIRELEDVFDTCCDANDNIFSNMKTTIKGLTHNDGHKRRETMIDFVRKYLREEYSGVSLKEYFEPNFDAFITQFIIDFKDIPKLITGVARYYDKANLLDIKYFESDEDIMLLALVEK